MDAGIFDIVDSGMVVKFRIGLWSVWCSSWVCFGCKVGMYIVLLEIVVLSDSVQLLL